MAEPLTKADVLAELDRVARRLDGIGGWHAAANLDDIAAWLREACVPPDGHTWCDCDFCRGEPCEHCGQRRAAGEDGR